ncbi:MULTISPECIES: sporulation integral membrane protein YlbJ [Paenibacillus]|uniref:sporulation integral membrane protein YlbJ n=1 Tax=Paenibacillus TaxID=44249 RepID=UPI0022B8CEDE|nr:sporulation integral membrane protein YlbJ [Paenibacillus caseinilyticus]MCZ8522780.1 sporulation integral membrane protein YlbJ [Paenibacillus caseinilyticus]
MRRRMFPFYAATLFVISLAGLMLIFPSEALRASLKGVSIWWDVLFPALFPFFVISEMMLGVGIVHFFGTLLDPLMRPLFRIPGIGGFVMAMGFASGYPIGARLTAQLWEQKLVNREEGERLVAFTTSADPIFLIGAVSVGFFHDAALAGVLAAAHYGAAVIVGLMMRFHGKLRTGNNDQPASSPVKGPGADAQSIGRRAFNAMHEARLKDGRPLGVMLQSALGSGLQLMFVVGGLVVFFSVVMEVMTSAHIMKLLYTGAEAVLRLFALPAPLAEAVVGGFFEVTIGAKAAGGAAGVPLVYKAAIAAWVLSWGGLSVHAQIVSLLHRTDLRYAPFAVARLVHGLLAALLVLLLWEPLVPAQVFWSALPEPEVSRPAMMLFHHILPAAGIVFAGSIGVLLLLTLLYSLGKRGMNPR